MADKPASPFAGLDKALLRSTHPVTAAPAPPQPAEVQDTPKEVPAETPTPATPARKSPPRPRLKASKLDSHEASLIASTDDSMLASYQTQVIADIRKIVKVPGREVSFVRLTLQEKGELADIVYSYKRQGKKTSENEIHRIAINFILHDYKASGKNSLLVRVIEALLA